MRFAVLVQGVLRGMGREERVEMVATKTVLPGADRPVYSHCAIIDAPGDLPDGEYEIEFAGEIAWTERRKGIWTVGQTLPHSPADLTAFMEHGSGPMGRPLSRRNGNGARDDNRRHGSEASLQSQSRGQEVS